MKLPNRILRERTRGPIYRLEIDPDTGKPFYRDGYGFRVETTVLSDFPHIYKPIEGHGYTEVEGDTE